MSKEKKHELLLVEIISDLTIDLRQSILISINVQSGLWQQFIHTHRQTLNVVKMLSKLST
jgi:hypothetical protein